VSLVQNRLAHAILQHIEARVVEDGLVAFALAAEAVPRRHFK
jgi:hypothetical protein